MKLAVRIILFGMAFTAVTGAWIRADQVEMQNGDRYFGRVLSVSADTLVFESEMLGKINVPRQKVAGLAFGTNGVTPQAANNMARVSGSTNPPTATVLAKPNVDLSAAFRQLGVNTNFIGQIREQMLAGSPAAGGKYDAMVNGLVSGQMNLGDLRREAQSSADQIRELKRDLGPDAGDSLDGYLEVLDQFLKESAAEPANATIAPTAQAH